MNTPKLASIAIAALLSGCATVDTYWSGPVSPSYPNYRWEQVSADQAFHSCGFKYYGRGMSCVFRLRNSGEPYCLIHSTLSEDEAKQVMDFRNEYSMWNHEYVQHCVNGKSHPGVSK